LNFIDHGILIDDLLPHEPDDVEHIRVFEHVLLAATVERDSKS
jgi:hypothetical protein